MMGKCKPFSYHKYFIRIYTDWKNCLLYFINTNFFDIEYKYCYTYTPILLLLLTNMYTAYSLQLIDCKYVIKSKCLKTILRVTYPNFIL